MNTPTANRAKPFSNTPDFRVFRVPVSTGYEPAEGNRLVILGAESVCGYAFIILCLGPSITS